MLRIWCDHEWSVLTETTTKSTYEHAIVALKEAGAVTNISLPWQLCDGERKFIQIVSCEKCGKLKRFVENI